MHQIQFLLGLHPRSHWGAYSTPPNHLTVFKESTSKGREGEGEWSRRGRRREGRERRGKREDGEGGREGPVKSVKPTARKVASPPLLISTPARLDLESTQSNRLGRAEKSTGRDRPNWSKDRFRIQNFQTLKFAQKVHFSLNRRPSDPFPMILPYFIP